MRRALQDSYDRSAAGYDAGFTALQTVKYAALLQGASSEGRAALQRGPALDLGCGTGLLAAWLAERGLLPPTLVGLDLSRGMLRRAGSRLSHRVQADAARLPLAPGSFRVVVCVTVLALFDPDLLTPLRQVRRVLAPDGWLLLSVLKARGAQAASALSEAGFLAGPALECGQDLGWAARRV